MIIIFITKAISFEKRCFDLKSKIQSEHWKLASKRVEVYDVSYVPFQNTFLHFENKAHTTTLLFRKHYEKSTQHMYTFQEVD